MLTITKNTLPYKKILTFNENFLFLSTWGNGDSKNNWSESPKHISVQISDIWWTIFPAHVDWIWEPKTKFAQNYLKHISAQFFLTFDKLVFLSLCSHKISENLTTESNVARHNAGRFFFFHLLFFNEETWGMLTLTHTDEPLGEILSLHN